MGDKYERFLKCSYFSIKRNMLNCRGIDFKLMQKSFIYRWRTKDSKYVHHPSVPSHLAASQRIMDFSVYLSTHVTHPLTAAYFAPRRWIVHKISHHVENYTQTHNTSEADYSFSGLIGMQHNISNYCWS